MKKIMGIKNRWLVITMVCLISLGAVSMAGCAGKTKTSTVTTQTTNGVSGSGGTSSVTTQKEVETSAHPRGVIGGLFYTIGQVLIWPFKAIASLF
ncbi:MAG: hypothetical protein WC530_01695 [Candidatus Omnitrophota bacterium]|jgi:hypothetical protein